LEINNIVILVLIIYVPIFFEKKQGIKSQKINEPYLELVHTSSSPFKVSIVDPNDIQPPLIKTSADINHSQLTSSNSQLGNLVLKILKILIVFYNFSYLLYLTYYLYLF